MASSRGRGTDGIPFEFYKAYWPQITYTLHSLFLKIIDDNELNITAKEGYLALLDKPGRDPLDMDNWR